MHIQFFSFVYVKINSILKFFSNFVYFLEKMNEKNPIEPIQIEYFQNLKNACLLGIDIGGSLVKIAYSSSYECKTAAFSEVYLLYLILNSFNFSIHFQSLF